MNNLDIEQLIESDKINYKTFAYRYTNENAYTVSADMVLSAHWLVRLEAQEAGIELDAIDVYRKIQQHLLRECNQRLAPASVKSIETEDALKYINNKKELDQDCFNLDPLKALELKEFLAEREQILEAYAQYLPILKGIFDGKLDGSNQILLGKSLAKRTSSAASAYELELKNLKLLIEGKNPFPTHEFNDVDFLAIASYKQEELAL